tara:strand:- start:1579 stop:2019 length:441 start_codon:yes stop_codon:yes gene_type:complete
MVEKTKISYKGKSKNVPKKYIGTLKGEEKKKQVKSIIEGKDRPKTSAPQRRSSFTIKFDKQYGEQLDKMKGGRNKKNIAKITGIPFKAIDEVYKKGEGAYKSSGSRPNQSAQSWARGRIYGYIMGNKKVRKVDKDITEKYKVKFKF